MTDIKKIGIVGAGQMGRGIAQVTMLSEYPTTLFDIDTDGLALGTGSILEKINREVDKKRWTPEVSDKILSSLKPTTNMGDLHDCDLVIEAATEAKETKFDIIRNLDSIVSSDAIVASNTSSISITELASESQRPQNVVGMHFMNPAPIMPLIEGIRGLETSDYAFDCIEAVATRMGKAFIKVNDVAGFAVNRILLPMINEAIFTHYEGVASIEDIDLGMRLGTNQPMGPFELADFIGLDTCLSIMNILHESLGDPKYRPCPLLKQYVAAGRLGRKSRRGFYQY